ncbi:MAG: diacylglycerol kinase family protein [Pelobium sp.]
MAKEKFSLINRIKSFAHAINGLKLLFREEHNARVHLVVAILVVIAGFVSEISIIEWMMITFAIGLVISIEILNTAIEKTADFISPERNEQIKVIKDLAAGAVLVSTITSVIIGLLVFVPKLLQIL